MWRICCAAVAAIVLSAALATSTALTQPLPEAPQVNLEQYADRGFKSEGEAEDQQENAKPPIAIDTAGPCAAEERRTNAHQGADENTEFWTIFGHRLKITDTLLAAFTLLLVIVGIGQVYWMKRTTDDARIAITTLQRAFVYLDDFESDFSIFPTSRLAFESDFVIKPIWKNSGSTPARNVRIRVNWVIEDGELPDDFVYSYEGRPSHTFLGPGAREWSTPISICKGRAQIVADGNGKLYVWGRADYEDIFVPKSRPHFIQFCSRVTFSDGPNAVAIFTPYGDYNKSDDQQTKRQPLWRRLMFWLPNTAHF